MAAVRRSVAGVACCLLGALVVPTTARPFLQQVDTREEAEASLMAKFVGTFRASATKDHIMEIEAKLQPMYTAMPKNDDGTLSHAVVRYVLHRFFAQRGWFIRGLAPTSSSKNSASTDTWQDLVEWVPDFLQKFLEQLGGGRGASSRELAVLAATIEDLVHKEAINRLRLAFKALQLPTDVKLDLGDVNEVLEVFMMIYQTSDKFEEFVNKGVGAVRRAHNIFTLKLKDWAAIQEWMAKIKREMYPDGVMDFGSLERVVEAVGERYGTYNEKECGALKSSLLEVESKKAGRVRLAEFYKKGLTGVFQFNEKVDYLRDLGAIDESDPSQPHVIVSNYVSSRANCLKASHFYVICCRSGCEDLMGKLELGFAEEDVAPERILKLVATFSSDTIEAPRVLSYTLVQRLESIAESNGGTVPLHGRLFAQWMHHAFPRECPFPQEAGSANPQTPDEWMQGTSQTDTALSKEELVAHVSGDTAEHPVGAEARKYHEFQENELPWSTKEDLLMPSRTSHGKANWCSIPSVVVFILLGSLVYGMAWAAKQNLLSRVRGTSICQKGGMPGEFKFA